MSSGPGMQLLSMSDEAILEPGVGVRSIQQAEYCISAAVLDKRWCPEGLACLARQYWRPVTQRSGRLLRLLGTDQGPRLVLGVASLALIRFDRPRYFLGHDNGEVSWSINTGLLVSAAPVPDRGVLRVMVRRRQSARSPDVALLHLTVEVEGFQPRLRSRGRFARVGTWVYRHTQLRLHAWQARAFMRSLAQRPPAASEFSKPEIL